MKGVTALFLGIFGTFAFSWAGLTLIPNFQIGHLDPQADEEFIPCRNPAWRSAVARFTRRMAAFIVTASKYAPITPLPILIESGVPGAARPAIIFSSARLCSVR